MLLRWDGIGQVMSGAWFPPDVMIGIEAKELNLGLIRPENLDGIRLGKLQASCHVPSTEEWLPSGHSTIKA